MRRLKTGRRPPIYPKTPGHLPCSSLTHPLPLPSRRPSVSFGGFGVRGYLAELDEAAYEEAAAGWGGDRFSLLEGPLGETALAVLIVWDTATDAREFFDVVGAGPGASDAAYVGLSGDRVLLVIGPDETVKTEIRQPFPGF